MVVVLKFRTGMGSCFFVYLVLRNYDVLDSLLYMGVLGI